MPHLHCSARSAVQVWRAVPGSVGTFTELESKKSLGPKLQLTTYCDGKGVGLAVNVGIAVAVGISVAVGGTGVSLGMTVTVNGRAVSVNGSVGYGVTVLPGNGVGYGVRVGTFGTQSASPA